MNYIFLPEIERNKLKREYKVRVLVVLFFVLSVANMFGIVSLFPTYINSKILETAELEKISAINKKNNENGLDTIKKDLLRDSLYLGNAEQVMMTPTFYEPIKNIILAKGSTRLSSISVSSFSTSTISFVVQGVSSTREDLIAFKNRLMSSIPGTTVDLPLSALSKSKDIQFALNITSNI